jgi:phospholipase/lecithinase/hemolysin
LGRGGDDFGAGISAVQTLVVGGASNFLVPNLPDLSLTPKIQNFGEPAIIATHSYSVNYNAKLAAALSGIPDINLYIFDTFYIY